MKSTSDIQSQVEKISFKHTRKVIGGSIEVVFYDTTTLYFEATDEDDLRIPSFSKDGKHSCPQIFLRLLVAARGKPIGYEIYEGNIFEGNTLIPVIENLAKKHGFTHPIVVVDAGLLSKNNIKSLEEQGYEYILGARIFWIRCRRG
ncbi:transposase [Bacteroides sp. 90-K9/2]|uniref:IS1634 family transposase n=1 Tax=Bacteroides sp. 90-K9/2 TaxID=3142453 RepID=UPI0039B4E904